MICSQRLLARATAHHRIRLLLLPLCASCDWVQAVAVDCFAAPGFSIGVYLVALTGDSSAVVRFQGDDNYPASDSRGLLYFRDACQSHSNADTKLAGHACTPRHPL